MLILYVATFFVNFLYQILKVATNTDIRLLKKVVKDADSVMLGDEMIR